MIETEGIPRLNSTSHEWVKHPTRLIARFPGARLKKQEGRQSPFWTVCGPYPSKRLPAALNWIGFSYSPLRAPFWTVCGPYPSKRLPAASNWIGFSYSRLQAPFWTVCGPYPSKRLPAASNWTASHLWVPLSSCNGLDPAKWALRVSNGICA